MEIQLVRGSSRHCFIQLASFFLMARSSTNQRNNFHRSYNSVFSDCIHIHIIYIYKYTYPQFDFIKSSLLHVQTRRRAFHGCKRDTFQVLAVNVSCVPLDMCSPWREGEVGKGQVISAAERWYPWSLVPKKETSTLKWLFGETTSYFPSKAFKNGCLGYQVDKKMQFVQKMPHFLGDFEDLLN